MFAFGLRPTIKSEVWPSKREGLGTPPKNRKIIETAQHNFAEPDATSSDCSFCLVNCQQCKDIKFSMMKKQEKHLFHLKWSKIVATCSDHLLVDNSIISFVSTRSDEYKSHDGVMWSGWSSEFRWLLFFLVVSLIRDQRRPEGWSHSTFHTRGWKCSQKADLEQMGTTLNMINRETFLNTLTDIMISLKCNPIIRWSLKSENFSTECLIWFFHSGRLKIWYKIPKLFSLKTLLWLWINRLQMFVGSKVIVLFISV